MPSMHEGRQLAADRPNTLGSSSIAGVGLDGLGDGVDQGAELVAAVPSTSGTVHVERRSAKYAIVAEDVVDDVLAPSSPCTATGAQVVGTCHYGGEPSAAVS